MTKNGCIEITKQSWLKVEACNGRMHFNISPFGRDVLYKIFIFNIIKHFYIKKNLNLD